MSRFSLLLRGLLNHSCQMTLTALSQKSETETPAFRAIWIDKQRQTCPSFNVYGLSCGFARLICVWLEPCV